MLRRERTEAEYGGWLEGVRLSLQRVVRTRSAFSLIEATRA